VPDWKPSQLSDVTFTVDATSLTYNAVGSSTSTVKRSNILLPKNLLSASAQPHLTLEPYTVPSAGGPTFGTGVKLLAGDLWSQHKTSAGTSSLYYFDGADIIDLGSGSAGGATTLAASAITAGTFGGATYTFANELSCSAGLTTTGPFAVVGSSHFISSSYFKSRVFLDGDITFVLNDIYVYGWVNTNDLTSTSASFGKIGIGTAVGSYQLELSQNNAGKPTSEHWTTISDARIKENIVPVSGALNMVLQLNGREFEYIDKAVHGSGSHIGFIAQEVEEVIPRWVKTGADGFKTLTIAGDNALLVEAIKEQHDLIIALQTRIEQLEAKVI
jgi:hypothetical protein